MVKAECLFRADVAKGGSRTLIGRRDPIR